MPLFHCKAMGINSSEDYMSRSQLVLILNLAQSQIKETSLYDDYLSLSVFIKVKATPQGKVKFAVIPEDTYLQKTIVELTVLAWQKSKSVVDGVNEQEFLH